MQARPHKVKLSDVWYYYTAQGLDPTATPLLVIIVMKSRRKTWSVADAKAHLSAVIEQALSEGPQTITRYGKESVVVVSAEEWRRRSSRKGHLAEFFAASPLRGSGIDLERLRDAPRNLDL
jgi:prevent-host-death family protein